MVCGRQRSSGRIMLAHWLVSDLLHLSVFLFWCPVFVAAGPLLLLRFVPAIKEHLLLLFPLARWDT
jgi:hypothetical protein